MPKYILLLLILHILVPKQAIAETCAPPDAHEGFHNNDYVFTARVQRTHEAGELPSRLEEGLHNTYTMAVVKIQKVYKGRVFGPMKVYANNYWGAPFEVGKSYLIFANIEGSLMVAPDCSGTMLLDDAGFMIEALEEIQY